MGSSDLEAARNQPGSATLNRRCLGFVGQTSSASTCADIVVDMERGNGSRGHGVVSIWNAYPLI